MTDELLKQSVVEINNLLEDKQITDIVALDMGKIVSYTDVFLIGTGRNARQLKSVYSDLRVLWKERHAVPGLPEGDEEGNWILIDMGDVVVHLFTEDGRQFYDLENLWINAPRLDPANP